MISFLFVNDQWLSTSGGISVVNRELAAELARQGYPVACLLPLPSPAEIANAEACGVRLLRAEETPAGPDLILPSSEAARFRPDVIVGHDRVSGIAAWAQARRYLHTRLVHIVHTAPSEIERYKPRDGATLRIEEREQITRQIARDADVVAAIGARVTRHTASVLREGNYEIPVLRLDPGITPSISDRKPPARPLVLVLGRTDVMIKGLGIAARAVGDLPRVPRQPPPTLLIRGAPVSGCDELYTRLLVDTRLSGSQLDVRPFTSTAGETLRDLSRATVCIMPSRVEGFGLSALEAIGAGTPVLLSARSGLAETLQELLGPLADRMILDVVDHPERNASTWTAAIARVLEDPEEAFAYAATIRDILLPRLTWHAAASALVSRIEASVGSQDQHRPIPRILHCKLSAGRVTHAQP